MAVVAALLVPTLNARTEPLKPVPKVGEEYEISKSYETSRQTSGGASGSSHGRETILERVIGVREAGLELEYDLPKGATAEARAREWQFPVRVFRPSGGAMQLLNRRELEARLEGWLKAAGWPRTVCGSWIFTWNAFRIECDPQSVIETIEAFDLRSIDLREGASYLDLDARRPGTLVRKAAGPNGSTFAAVMEVDPNAIRRARAQADVVVGEIMREPVTLDTAFRERAKENIRGTISITFDTDAAGNVRRRTRVTKLEIERPDGESETARAREKVERRLVSAPPSHR
ncbi:MAG TPA: hypothetical protein VGW34_07460 [Allosphingosinicella sp.]|nr:hypothetical protein [Allosphingosinicella sp.]